MVDTNFTLVSGTYSTEVDLFSELDFFMVNTIGGWTRVKDITSGSTHSIVYYTDGSVSGTVTDRFWLKVERTVNFLTFYGMSNFNTTTDAASDQFGGTGTAIDFTYSGSASLSGTYWFAGNQDAMHVLVELSDLVGLGHLGARAQRYGGFGTFISYYTPQQDPKPFYVFGDNTSFSTSNRLFAYSPHSWGVSQIPTYSGGSLYYSADHPVQINYGNPNPRSGQAKLVEPVFYTNTTFGKTEVRGRYLDCIWWVISEKVLAASVSLIICPPQFPECI